MGRQNDRLVDELSAGDTELIRIQYPDLIGTERGRDVLIDAFGDVLSAGLSFCRAIYYTTTQGEAIDSEFSLSAGLPDARLRPDTATLAPVPWEPGTAWCMGEMYDAVTDEPLGECPRAALRSMVDLFSRAGHQPIVGPELEFFVLEPDETSPVGWRRYGDTTGNVYRVGRTGDPEGLLRELLHWLRAAKLGVTSGNHEFCAGQFEINLAHSAALDAADRAFRFKHAVREVVARHESPGRSLLRATFTGRPFNDEGGSGFHLHLSLLDEDGHNLFDDPRGPHGLSEVAAHAVGGILAHAPALSAFLAPTVNAYKRLGPNTLAPHLIDWGLDNRCCLVRVPPERGEGTRLEVRLGDASASPYLAIAAILAAVHIGVSTGRKPPEPLTGYGYDPSVAAPLPRDLDGALTALESDSELQDVLGKPLSTAFTTVKRDEVERFRRWVTDWELREYLRHL